MEQVVQRNKNCLIDVLRRKNFFFLIEWKRDVSAHQNYIDKP